MFCTTSVKEVSAIFYTLKGDRRFMANESIFMEAQANSWENENPQRIAFIER